MKNQIKIATFSAVILLTGITGCTNQAARITPGFLEVSNHVETHSAKIMNIVELSEKEAPDEKMFQGVLTGALIGAVLTKDGSDDANEIGTAIGAMIGEHAVMEKHGKTIYRLSLALDDGTFKDIYVRGGHYQLGRASKVTINKESGEISSFKMANS